MFLHGQRYVVLIFKHEDRNLNVLGWVNNLANFCTPYISLRAANTVVRQPSDSTIPFEARYTDINALLTELNSDLITW